MMGQRILPADTARPWCIRRAPYRGVSAGGAGLPAGDGTAEKMGPERQNTTAAYIERHRRRRRPDPQVALVMVNNPKAAALRRVRWPGRCSARSWPGVGAHEYSAGRPAA
ncbi:hypothetical protein M8494_11475 [Serratia ureilytica]